MSFMPFWELSWPMKDCIGGFCIFAVWQLLKAPLTWDPMYIWS